MINLAQIYSLDESGATGSWEWSISLTKNIDGSYGLILEQVLWDSTDDAEPGYHALPSFTHGSEMFDFLQKAWATEHEEDLDELAWREILSNVQTFAPALFKEIDLEVKKAFISICLDKSAKEISLERCIASANWKRQIFSGGGAMWAAIAERKKMLNAVRSFVEDYHEKNGKLPTGEHQIFGKSVTFPLI